MSRLNTRNLVLMALLITLQIIFTRFLSIQTPIVRIDLNFLPLSMCAALFGPIWGGIAAAAADFIGVTIFPVGGAYFPGFTLSTFLMGFIYGSFLYDREKSIARISIAVLLVMLICSITLDSIWVMITTGKTLAAFLPVRLIRCVLMFPIQIALIRLSWNAVCSRLNIF